MSTDNCNIVVELDTGLVCRLPLRKAKHKGHVSLHKAILMNFYWDRKSRSVMTKKFAFYTCVLLSCLLFPQHSIVRMPYLYFLWYWNTTHDLVTCITLHLHTQPVTVPGSSRNHKVRKEWSLNLRPSWLKPAREQASVKLGHLSTCRPLGNFNVKGGEFVCFWSYLKSMKKKMFPQKKFLNIWRTILKDWIKISNIFEHTI